MAPASQAYNDTIAADQQAVEKYLEPVASERGKRRWCAVCEQEQRGTVCSVCRWDLVPGERTGPKVEPLVVSEEADGW